MLLYHASWKGCVIYFAELQSQFLNANAIFKESKFNEIISMCFLKAKIKIHPAKSAGRQKPVQTFQHTSSTLFPPVFEHANLQLHPHKNLSEQSLSMGILIVHFSCIHGKGIQTRYKHGSEN